MLFSDSKCERGPGARATPGDLALVSQIDSSISGLIIQPTLQEAEIRTPKPRLALIFLNTVKPGGRFLVFSTKLLLPPLPVLVATANNQPYEPFATTYSGSAEARHWCSRFQRIPQPWKYVRGVLGQLLDATGWRRWYFREFGNFPSVEEERDAFLTHEERLSFWRRARRGRARRLSLSSELELRFD